MACLLDDPNDPAEIAARLRTVLDSGPHRSEAIAALRAAYSWPKILARFEQHLMECAD